MARNNEEKGLAGVPLSRRRVLTGAAAAAAAAAIPATRANATDFQPMTLKTHNWGPPRALTAGYEWWAQRVTDRTGGAIKFEHLYSSALVAGPDQLDGLRGGLFDVGGISTGFAPGKVPLWTVDTLRGIGKTGDVAAMARAMADIAKTPQLEGELARWNTKFLFYTGSGADEWLGTKPLRTIDDLKGMRLWTYGPGNTRMFHSLGAVPTSLTTAEIYESIGRGTLDGAHFPLASGGALGLTDIVTHVTLLGTGPTGWPVVISLNAWNKLDPEVQKIMEEEALEVPEKYAFYANKGVVEWLPKFAEKATVVGLPEAEKEKMRETAMIPSWEAWVQDNGEDGRAVLDALVAASEKHGA